MFHCSLVSAARKFVSLRLAKSCVYLPEKDAIGKGVRDLPPNAVTAYVTPDVITVEEEKALLNFSNPMFDRLPFDSGHMDGLIHHYKEFYRSYTNLVKDADKVAVSGFSKARSLSEYYLPNIPIDDRVHFLRLEDDGFIRSHVDESRNSSGLVGGLVLGSSRIMTLTNPKFPGEKVELLLAPRCFYALIGRARYEWEHSVDWSEDDAEHIHRIQKKQPTRTRQPVVFEGEETEFFSGTRTAIIFRGVSPLALLQQRMSEV